MNIYEMSFLITAVQVSWSLLEMLAFDFFKHIKAPELNLVMSLPCSYLFAMVTTLYSIGAELMWGFLYMLLKIKENYNLHPIIYPSWCFPMFRKGWEGGCYIFIIYIIKQLFVMVFCRCQSYTTLLLTKLNISYVW